MQVCTGCFSKSSSTYGNYNFCMAGDPEVQVILTGSKQLIAELTVEKLQGTVMNSYYNSLYCKVRLKSIHN
jgi:hypothetical protein